MNLFLQIVNILILFHISCSNGFIFLKNCMKFTCLEIFPLKWTQIPANLCILWFRHFTTNKSIFAKRKSERAARFWKRSEETKKFWNCIFLLVKDSLFSDFFKNSLKNHVTHIFFGNSLIHWKVSYFMSHFLQWAHFSLFRRYFDFLLVDFSV